MTTVAVRCQNRSQRTNDCLTVRENELSSVHNPSSDHKKEKSRKYWMRFAVSSRHGYYKLLLLLLANLHLRWASFGRIRSIHPLLHPSNLFFCFFAWLRPVSFSSEMADTRLPDLPCDLSILFAPRCGSMGRTRGRRQGLQIGFSTLPLRGSDWPTTTEHKDACQLTTASDNRIRSHRHMFGYTANYLQMHTHIHTGIRAYIYMHAIHTYIFTYMHRYTHA